MPRRTTLTLEDDVAERLREEARRTGRSLKTVVNEALRSGLAREVDRHRSAFKVEARELGLRPEFDFDHIEGVLDQLDGPLRR